MATVVIIDDQQTSRHILAQLVTSIEGPPEVITFASPVEALVWTGKNRADLILTDYTMPKLNGIEFIRRFRDQSGCDNVPVIMVTSSEERKLCYDALEAGATDFLMKPVDHQECLARCRNLLTQYRQYRIIRDKSRWLERQIDEATSELRLRERETLLRLAKAGEYRDEETGNHVFRMAKYSRLIAEELGFSDEDADIVEMAAAMHDIGKIGIRDEILLKPGKLTTAEFEIMKSHTIIGYDILKDSPSQYLQMGAVMALGHHERYDGTGYPYARKGKEIPIEARIAAVADVFDALVSVRPHKGPWELEVTLEYMTTQRGKHFDPACFDAFLARIDTIIKIHNLLPDEPIPDIMDL